MSVPTIAVGPEPVATGPLFTVTAPGGASADVDAVVTPDGTVVVYVRRIGPDGTVRAIVIRRARAVYCGHVFGDARPKGER